MPKRNSGIAPKVFGRIQSGTFGHQEYPESNGIAAKHKANARQRLALSSILHIREDQPIEVSREAKVLNRSIVMGDVAAFREDGHVRFGDVYIHAIIDDQHWTCISEWDVLEKPRNFVAKCRVALQPRIVKLDCLLEPVIVSSSAHIGSIATILLPSKYA